MAKEIDLTIPGRRLAARVWGPADGRRVLALHGWQDSAATFDLIAPLLPELRIVALDLTGHGLSEHLPPGVSYTFLEWVVDVHAAAGALEWDRFTILGHSLGAGIANALAATWPERVERVVAIDGFAPRTDDADSGPERLAEHVQKRTRNSSALPRIYPDVAAAAARLCERIRGLTPEGARVLASRGTQPLAHGGVTWRRDPRIQAGPPIRLSHDQIEGFLRAVQCPVRIVRPTDGWPVSDRMHERLREWIGDLEVEFVDGGHHVHLEHPQEIARLVRELLAR